LSVFVKNGKSLRSEGQQNSNNIHNKTRTDSLPLKVTFGPGWLNELGSWIT